MAMEDTAAYKLAMLGLQADRYRHDPEYRDAVDDVLAQCRDKPEKQLPAGLLGRYMTEAKFHDVVNYIMNIVRGEMGFTMEDWHDAISVADFKIRMEKR